MASGISYPSVAVTKHRTKATQGKTCLFCFTFEDAVLCDREVSHGCRGLRQLFSLHSPSGSRDECKCSAHFLLLMHRRPQAQNGMVLPTFRKAHLN